MLVLGLLLSVSGDDVGSNVEKAFFLRGVDPFVVVVSQLSPMKTKESVSTFRVEFVNNQKTILEIMASKLKKPEISPSSSILHVPGS